MTFTYEMDGRYWPVVIGSETIAECFDKALHHPLEMARDKIHFLSGFKNVRKKVVVSGRTSRHPALQSRLEQICNDAGISTLILTDTFDMNQE